MITVSELQQRRTKDLDSIVAEIEQKIFKAEDNGDRKVIHYLKANAPAEIVITELQQHGFRVNRNKGSDQRDGSWDYLEITWN